ncbi:MAG: MgtC/SapB family protein [Omnitrophica WOR_2 bacterium]
MAFFQPSYPLRFALALALGFLVGLERESSRSHHRHRLYAGVRTNSILSLFGFGCAWLSNQNITLALPIGLLSVAGLILVEYIDKLKHDHIGWTSEISALLVFITGALCLLTDIWLPLALGVVNVFLLSEKNDVEAFVERLDQTEFLAVLKFLLVTLIILPILPNQAYTQFQLNPARIWEIVILVSSIGFTGYILSKKFGGKVGLWLSGILGGIVSSTAVSVAMGRIAQNNPAQGKNALQASILASSVMYVRILVLIAIIQPIIAMHIAWKLIVLALVGLVFAVTIRNQPYDVAQNPPVIQTKNPFEILPALMFAGLFIALTIITQLVFRYLGNSGILALSAIVGVTDIDPYVLSIIHSTSSAQSLIVSAVVIAMMSNTVTKGIYFGILANCNRKETAVRYGIWALAHLPMLLIL